MKKKRTYNTRLVKKAQSYSIVEISALFNITTRTVLSWIKCGLSTIDDKKPYLILGENLSDYLKKRQLKKKHKCKVDEFYCCRCKIPKKSIPKKIILIVLTMKKGQLKGTCTNCGTDIFKIVSLANLTSIKQTFPNLKIQDKNLTGYEHSIINDNLRKETKS